jgi:fermentation-respiration switch protein FrsA (DUF1100 family)
MRGAALALFVLAAAAIALTLLWTMQRRLIYFPFGPVPAPGEVGLGQAESVRFPTSDGLELRAWFVAAEGPAHATVLVLPGNAGNRAYRAPLAASLVPHGYHVLLLDYRGYGGNPGQPGERGLAADARAARAYLAGRRGVDASRLVYFGESLGTAVAVGLAAEHPPAALVLRSPFTSLVDVGRHHYPILPVRLLLRDRFDAIRAIGAVRAPLLVVVGGRDEIIPPELSRGLYAAATGPRQLVELPAARHNDYELLAGERMIQAVVSFLREHVGRLGNATPPDPRFARRVDHL